MVYAHHRVRVQIQIFAPGRILDAAPDAIDEGPAVFKRNQFHDFCVETLLVSQGHKEIIGLFRVEEPFVAILRSFGRQAVLPDGSGPFGNRPAGLNPTVGKGNDDVLSSHTKEFVAHSMEVIEMLKRVQADDCIPLCIPKGQAVRAFEIGLDTGFFREADSRVTVRSKNALEDSLIAADIEDCPIQVAAKSLSNIGRAINAMAESDEFAAKQSKVHRRKIIVTIIQNCERTAIAHQGGRRTAGEDR